MKLAPKQVLAQFSARISTARRTRRCRRRQRVQPVIAAELLEVRCLLTAPVALPDSGTGFTTNEDTSFFTTANVLTNDSDGDGDTLSIISITGSSYGTVTANSDGTLSYMPMPILLDGLGNVPTATDNFSYTIDDGNGGQDSAQVTIVITLVNDAPNAKDDMATTSDATLVSIAVLLNDTDPESSLLTITSVSTADGTAAINGSNIDFTPTAGLTGATLTYTISDGSSLSDTATVTVMITGGGIDPPPPPPPPPPLNNLPVAIDDNVAGTDPLYETDEDTPFATPNVLGNDSDPDGDSLSIVSMMGGSYGFTSANNDGTITYSPSMVDYLGGGDTLTDSINYTIDDGYGGQDTAQVTIRIIGVNDAPKTEDDSAMTSVNIPVDIDVLTNDTDPEIDSLTIVPGTASHGIATVDDHGTLGDRSDDTVIFTPDDGYFGSASFTYHVFDGTANSNTSTVTINVGATITLEIGVDSEDSSGMEVPVSADEPQAYLGVSVILGFDTNGTPIYAEDGSVVQWQVSGVGGSLGSITTTTTMGYTYNVLTTGTTAGATYTVTATATQLVDCGTLTPVTTTPVTSVPIVVKAGAPSSLAFSISDDRIPADEYSTTQVTVTVQDAQSNVISDAMEVIWDVTGLASFVNTDSQSSNGQATAEIRSGWAPETCTVSATVGDLSGSTTFEAIAITISLSSSATSLVASSSDTATITADIKDADGNPLPDGVPINWYTQKGTLIGTDTIIISSLAQATLQANGRVNSDGTNIVAAWIGNNVGRLLIPFTIPVGQVFLQLDHYVLAGDEIADGVVAVEQADGSFDNIPYYATAQGTIVGGTPNGTVNVSIQNAPSGPTPLLINGVGGTVQIALDSSGSATFTISSTGSLPAGKVAAMEVVVDLLDTDLVGVIQNDRKTMGLMTKAGFAKTWNYVKKFAWGAFAGEGEGPTEAAGDLAISVIPLIGVYSDVRDVLKEGARIVPGGASPNWTVLAIAAAGIVAELFPVGDLALDAAKGLAKVLTNQVILKKLHVILTAAIKLDLTKLSDYGATLIKMWTDVPFRNLVDTVLVKSDAAFDALNRICSRIGVDDAATKLTNAATTYSNAGAKKFFDRLADLSDTQIDTLKNGNKLDVFAKGTAGNGDCWGKDAAKRYADDVATLGANHTMVKLFDEFADVKGTGKLLDAGGGIGNVGVQTELLAAKNLKNGGETVVEFRRKVGTRDFDIVTNAKVVEVKAAGQMNSMTLDQKKLDTFKGQLQHLKDNAGGKTPCLALPSGTAIPPAVQRVIDSVGGITIINF